VFKVGQQCLKRADKSMHKAKKQKTQESTTEQTEAEDKKPDSNNKEFRDRFMEAITFTFSEELEKLRNDENFDAKTISLLIDALESGKDTFTTEEEKQIHDEWVTQYKEDQLV